MLRPCLSATSVVPCCCRDVSTRVGRRVLLAVMVGCAFTGLYVLLGS